MSEPLQKVEVAPEQIVAVYRLVHVPEVEPVLLAPSFRSRRELGKTRLGRELDHAEVWEGLSVFKTLEGTRDLWASIDARLRDGQAVALGSYVARVELTHGRGFAYEDLDEPDGHMTIWGSPLEVAAQVVDIVPAHQGTDGG